MGAPERQDAKGLSVLQVVPELDAGGVERTTVDIAKAIVAGGGQAVVVSHGGRLVPELVEAGAIHITLPTHSKNPFRIAGNVRRLRNIIRNHNINIVHARSRAPAWSALRAARAEKLPFVTTYHGTYNATNGFKQFYNSIMARGDRVIANSAFIGGLIRTAYPALKPDIVVIPRGTDMSVFSRDAVEEERRAALRQEWALGDKPGRLILLPGRLTRWKGQAVLIEAMEILKKRGVEDFTAVIVGDPQGRDSYVAELWQMIDESGLKDRVRIAGHCEDIPAACSLADIVVSASTDPEAFGRVAVEGQAMECVVIASDHGGAKETVVTTEGAETGYRVPPNDEVALADRIESVLAMGDDGLAPLRKRARSNAQQHFSVEAMCASTINVYRSVFREF